jgi:hypothetical protein
MHYEVELHQGDPGDGGTGAGWRAVSLLVRPRAFTTLEAAQAHAKRLEPRTTRVVAVGQDGSRQVVDEAGT